jgi:hypothetical protein
MQRNPATTTGVLGMEVRQQNLEEDSLMEEIPLEAEGMEAEAEVEIEVVALDFRSTTTEVILELDIRDSICGLRSFYGSVCVVLNSFSRRRRGR